MNYYPTVLFFNEGGKIPTKMTSGAAGYDIFSAESGIVNPNQRKLVSTKIKMVIPEGYYAQLHPRSSLAIQGIDVGAGVIDSDYRGELKVLLVNNTEKIFHYEKEQRIAQMLLKPLMHNEIIKVISPAEFSDYCTKRNTGGFGSTGK